MLLVDSEIKNAVETLDLIENYNEDRVGPNSYDVLLGPEFARFQTKDSFIMSTSVVRDPQKSYCDMSWKTYKSKDVITLEPNEFILASTIESFKIPPDMYAIIMGKSTLAREGIQIESAGFIDSGFKGNLTLEIKNMLPCRYTLHVKQLIAQVCFFYCNEVEKPYESSYMKQTGVTTPKSLENLFKYCD